MSFKKNLRGAETYAFPSTPDYRDNYDRIFRRGRKEDAVCPGCGDGGKESVEVESEHGPIRIVACEKCCPDGEVRTA